MQTVPNCRQDGEVLMVKFCIFVGDIMKRRWFTIVTGGSDDRARAADEKELRMRKSATGPGKNYN